MTHWVMSETSVLPFGMIERPDAVEETEPAPAMLNPKSEADLLISVNPSERADWQAELLPAPVAMIACRPCDPSQEWMAVIWGEEGLQISI